MYPFNVRVYGLLINDFGQILLSDEEESGLRFCKFPGGGLEYGEGLIDALKREFKEECNVEVEVLEHFYTTDFFIKSVFDESQIISIYYLVKADKKQIFNIKEKAFDFEGDILQAFRWKNMSDLKIKDVYFPTDQKVVLLLIEKWQKNP